ncbi:MAG: hypothetical protein GY769_17605 [bacterium]|nr:hypothetical protein [bacterium]
MLEKGRWYRNPGGGVLLVEDVGFSGADVKVFTGVPIDVQYETREGGRVKFRAKQSRRSRVSSGSVLEVALQEEVEMFATPNGRVKAEAAADEGRPELKRSNPEQAGQEKSVPQKRKRVDHGKCTKTIEFTPEVRARKKAKGRCTYLPKPGDGKPATYRIVYSYEDGLVTYCRVCSDHARAYAEKQGLEVPRHPRTKGASG